MAKKGYWIAVLAALPLMAQQKAETKYGVPVKAGPMDSILLKDYRPESSLVVPRSEIRKARYGAIDVHSHSSMSNARTRAEVDAWVRTMDEVGVERSVVFTDATGKEFDRQAEMFLKSYPGRFQVWCGLDTSNLDAPDFPERAVRELERCYRMGARGVGELSDKGWGFDGGPIKHRPRDKRLHLEDPRLDAFWRKCAELRIPVNIHVADHPSCWRPLDAKQERSADFQAFSLYGKDVPPFEELMARRDKLLTRHRGTTFILCHLSNQGHDLATVGRLLDANPNLYLDIAARDYELGRQPRSAARFLEKYKSRILFGTDMGRDKEMYLGWWRLLESADEYMQGRAGWRHYGLALNDEVLRALYRDNALRLLNW